MTEAASIAAALGGRREGRLTWRCRCPACGRSNLVISAGGWVPVLVKCGGGGCDYKAVFRELFERGLIESDDDHDDRRNRRRNHDHEIRERHLCQEIARLQRGIERARGLYRRSIPAQGSIVEVYLRSRGIIPPIPPVLRFLRHCPHRRDPKYDRDYYPAMLVPVVDVDGHQIGLHKTFLTPDGSGKWPFPDKPFQRETCGPIGGGAVRLAPYDQRRALVIGEGIESTARQCNCSICPAGRHSAPPALKVWNCPSACATSWLPSTTMRTTPARRCALRLREVDRRGQVGAAAGSAQCRRRLQ